MSYNTVLLCSFIENTSDELLRAISRIKGSYDIGDTPIFILEDLEDQTRLILTYNIHKGDSVNYKKAIKDTIQVHRKKLTNTLYTLNALNEIVLAELGVIDPKHQVDWNQYSNSLVLVRDGALKVVRTRLKTTVS